MAKPLTTRQQQLLSLRSHHHTELKAQGRRLWESLGLDALQHSDLSGLCGFLVGGITLILRVL